MRCLQVCRPYHLVASLICEVLFLLPLAIPMFGQAPAASSASAAVPRLIRFSGAVKDTQGNPLSGTVGITFALYRDEQGGTPLWLETQNAQADAQGHYTVNLGATKSDGLPQELFVSGEARWLGAQVQGQAEQPRVLLMSVPYALKALDAETIGGRPASSFLLAPAGSTGSSSNNVSPDGTITGGGTANFVPLFTGTTTIGNSKIFQTVGGNVGIGTTTPGALLDVKGKGNVRDTLTLIPKSTHPTLSVKGTAFAVSNTGLVSFVGGQTFPGAGTVTSVGSGAGLTGGPITGSGTLSIASAGVTNAMLQHPSLTVTANGPLNGGGNVALGGSVSLGLVGCASNQILKWNGSSWACAADNNSGGTVTSVGSGLGLTGGPITGSGSLAIDTSAVPLLGAANGFTNNNSMAVNNEFTTLSVSNSGGGDGVDIRTSGGFGLYAASAYESVVGFGGYIPVSGYGGTAEGVFGENDTSVDFVTGIYGIGTGTSNKTIGVIGVTGSGTGAGVYGQNRSPQSGTATTNASGAGVWGDGGFGDSNGNGAQVGVIGTADKNAGVLALNNTTNFYTLAAFNSSTGGFPFTAYNALGKGCSIDSAGDINCSGSKNAVVPIDGGSRKVALSAIESPQNWFEDFGSEQLSNGTAVIRLEPEFAQTVNTQLAYHVFLTPKGDCKGLYVAHETSNSFEVHELGGGTSAVRFDYRIVALRKDFESIRMADHTNDPDPMQMIKQGPPTQFDTNQLIPPKRTAQLTRPITTTTKRR